MPSGIQRAWILSIGTELVLGQSLDTNAPWLAQRLGERGIRTTRHLTVADDLSEIRSALEHAAQAAELVIVSGGLGPTVDDLTREALAAAAGVDLALDAASLEQIKAFFAARGRTMPEANRSQALVPAGGRALPNSCGTAPGLRVTLHGTPVYALPGVPFEMMRMFEQQVLPDLAMGGRVLRSRELHCYGAGESEIGQRIADLMQRGRNPEVGTTAALGIIHVKINAAASSAEEVARLLDADEAEIGRRLGHLVYGRDEQTLGMVVGGMLGRTSQTLSVAESCTGGLIGRMITDVPGSSRWFRGGVICYSNEAKRDLLGVPEAVLAAHGAVSMPTAEAMAVGARARLGADFALSVTGIAGPWGATPDKPVGYVCIGLATDTGVEAREFRFGADSPRWVVRERSALTALNWLRRALKNDA